MNTDYHKEITQNILSFCGEEVLAVETTEREDLGLTLINFRVSDGKLFEGRRGEDALRALNYLVRQIAVSESDQENLLIDINDTNFNHFDYIQKNVKRVIEKVISTGKEQALPPQNPFERRISHHTIQSYDGVTSRSEGEGFDRHIIISQNQ